MRRSPLELAPELLACSARPMRLEQIHVECYSGYRANERPVAFTRNGQHHRVAEVVDRWYEGGRTPDEPHLDYFKVRTEGGEVCLLRYNSLFDAWAICLRD